MNIFRIAASKSVAITFGLLLTFASQVRGETTTSVPLPPGLPSVSFLYDAHARLTTAYREWKPTLHGPFLFDSLFRTSSTLEYFRAIPSTELRLFGFVGTDFSAERSRPGSSLEAMGAGLVAAPYPRVHLFGNFCLDEALASNPTYTGKRWRGLAGEIDHAYIRYDSRHFTATVGRFSEFWGPRQSLTLGASRSLDGFAYAVRWGRLSLQYRLARLDSAYPDRDTLVAGEPLIENRYFAGHRLEWQISTDFTLGLFETVIFGGPGRQIDLYYLNPLLSYHVAQLNDGADDNSIMGFDFALHPFERARLEGQLLLDDIQIDNEKPSDKEPAQYGVRIGGNLPFLHASTDFRFALSRVTNWTFNQPKSRNRYTMDGLPLGVVSGNDFQEGALAIDHWFRSDLRLSLELGYREQGEGSITAPWTAPWLLAEADYSEPVPSGSVERTRTAGLGMRGFPAPFLYIDLSTGVRHIQNAGHDDRSDRTSPFIRISLHSLVSFPLRVN